MVIKCYISFEVKKISDTSGTAYVCYDFLQVMPVSQVDVLREEAYMLFYVRHPKPAVRMILFSVLTQFTAR